MDSQSLPCLPHPQSLTGTSDTNQADPSCLVSVPQQYSRDLEASIRISGA